LRREAAAEAPLDERGASGKVPAVMEISTGTLGPCGDFVGVVGPPSPGGEEGIVTEGDALKMIGDVI
jgi:hypothetical protein